MEDPKNGERVRLSGTHFQVIGAATNTLHFRALSPAELLALRESDEAFGAESGLVAAEGLRSMVVSDYVSPAWLERLRVAVDRDPWEFGMVVIERATQIAVGMASFKGAPDADGIVEIAYGIAPAHRGRGYATQAANALVGMASANWRVRRIRAHTLPERSASTAVLTKAGFEMIGAVDDPEDGTLWRWERGVDEAMRPLADATTAALPR